MSVDRLRLYSDESSEDENLSDTFNERSSANGDTDRGMRDMDSDLEDYVRPRNPKTEYRKERRRYLAHEEQKGRGRPPLPQGSISIDSISTIPASDVLFSSEDAPPRSKSTIKSPASPDVKEVYNELQEISEKLKRESKMLQDRDVILKDKERALDAAHAAMEITIEQEVCRRIGQKQQTIEMELQKFEDQLKEKLKENKRLKENFDTLKVVNDTLRKEVDSLQSKHDRLNKQNYSLQARLTNLQRQQGKQDRKETDQFADVSKNRLTTSSTHSSKPQTKSKLKVTISSQEVIGILLDWVSEVNLKVAFDDRFLKSTGAKQTDDKAEALVHTIQDKCCRILPFLTDLLKELPPANIKIITPCLQFIYWSVLHLENVQSHQKTALTSTLRRVGEELYRARAAKVPEVDLYDIEVSVKEKPKEQAVFLRSPDPHVRLLSSLIIIKTVNQVDHLAHVYDVLRSDLKSDSGKELFLHYHATPVMLPHLRPSSKAICGLALDIYLQMSMESIYLRGFLDTCSREQWFQIVSLLWRMPGAEPKLLEKLSIILQKLSKLKSNKKYFEVYGITTSCQEYLTSFGNESAFLTLNLKSILFNLNITKTKE